jgi:hypothetical protein
MLLQHGSNIGPLKAHLYVRPSVDQQNTRQAGSGRGLEEHAHGAASHFALFATYYSDDQIKEDEMY